MTTVAIISSGLCVGAVCGLLSEVSELVGVTGAASPASGIAGRSAVPLLIFINNAFAFPLAYTSFVAFIIFESPSRVLLTK